VNTIIWKPVIERESEVLDIFQIAKGREFYPETLEIDFKPKRIKYENKFYYLDLNEMMAEYNILKQKYENDPEFFRNLVNKAMRMGENLVFLSKDITKDFKNKSNKELAELFVKYNNELLRYAPFAWSIFTIEKILTEKLNEKLKIHFPNLNEDELREIFFILITPKKKSSTVKEYKSVLKIAVLYRKNKTFNEEMEEEIKDVYEKFSWLGAMSIGWTYLKESYDMEYYRKIILELSEENPEETLKKLIQQENDKIKEYNKFIENNNLDDELINEASLLSEFIFLRTARGEYIVHSHVYVYELLKEISLRFKLDTKDIVYFTPDEIVKMLLKGDIPDFRSRKKGFNILIENGKEIITPTS
jgi:rubrerythrin